MLELFAQVAARFIMGAIRFAVFANQYLPNLAQFAKMAMRRPTAGVGRAGKIRQALNTPVRSMDGRPYRTKPQTG